MHASAPPDGCGARSLKIVIPLVATFAFWLGQPSASAQIISTSIPRVETATGGQAEEKVFAIHLMASPFSKWRYNEIVSAPSAFAFGTVVIPAEDIGIFSGTPNSDFLLAGEAVVKLGRSFSIGGGGWYNKVGKVNYDFRVTSYFTDTGDVADQETGTLNGDLKLSEGHVSVFYKDFGVQAGIVHTRSTLLSARIAHSANFPALEGGPLGSVEQVGQDSSATDWDLYGVYKYAGRSGRPYGLSFGAGVYDKKGSTETSQRAAEDQVVFSGFITGSIDVYKGFGIDLSYWYIAKTKADLGLAQPVSSEHPASRFTIGFAYTFSR